MSVSHQVERFRAVVAVHLFLLRSNGQEVLLLRRANTDYMDGHFSVVAGHLDGGERVEAAAAREAFEEVGVRIREDDITVVGVMHRLATDERIDFFVNASAWQGAVHNAEPEKCDELRWARIDGLPEPIIPYIRCALENYRDGRWFDVFGWE